MLGHMDSGHTLTYAGTQGASVPPTFLPSGLALCWAPCELPSSASFTLPLPGPVLLLTNPVTSGYVQSPISVYYCYDRQGGTVTRCIAEVSASERMSRCIDASSMGVREELTEDEDLTLSR